VVIIEHPSCMRWRRIAGLLPLFVASGVFAAPEFISGSMITRGAAMAEITVELACVVEYVDHLPANRGDRLRINLQSTKVCNGVSPSVADSRQQYRPLDADKANLVEVVYESDMAAGQTLTFVFNDSVRYNVVQRAASNAMIVRVYLDAPVEVPPREASGAAGVRVPAEAQPALDYVINLSSSRRPHAPSDIPQLVLQPGTNLYESEIDLAGVPWYRLRLGPFRNIDEANAELNELREQFPTAWIGRDTGSSDTAVDKRPGSVEFESPYIATNNAFANIGLDQVDVLMSDARRAMVAGEVSRAVQIYTKVLQVPNHDRYPEALEYLALAREKNGQTAHAKAEYQRYLTLYPDNEGAVRVKQRLAALIAGDRQTERPDDTSGTMASSRQTQRSAWRLQTFFSQYYRRDANQQNGEEQVISQSAIYSDINLDARRRGERFDFSSRLSAGYRNDFLAEDQGSGDATRVSYAYADLSRNTGGVLGRFDGLNLGYQLNERVLLNTVFGRPAYSASDNIDSTRSFYGASINYGPVLENLDLGMFYIEQNIEGIRDRQAVGTEFRYFGTNQSLWGMVDYDLTYTELASAFLQGSWRFPSRLSLHGLADRRGSPYLSTGNAMIGQSVASFGELAEIFTEDELRQLSLDRTSMSTTYAVGLSYPLSPKLQISADASRSTMEGTPASGGVLETPGTAYSYYSGSLVASSLLKEGDVSILSARYSDSDTSKVISMTLDSRFPIGAGWRINPRLRVDRRQNMMDSTYEWLYTPGLRIYYRRSQKFRLELEAGKQFSQRETTTANSDRESYFVNIGYQAFF
jgi:tetratricopeptide (TPR) repeat protein